MKQLPLTLVLSLLLYLQSPFLYGQVPLGIYSVLDLGALADGKTLNTAAIQQTIDLCAKNGGGKVLIPPGKYLTGALFLRSHVNIEIMAGARLIASPNFEDFPPIDGRWEGIERKVYASMFTGHDLENVSITGRGTLDGNGQPWWEAHDQTKAIKKERGITERESPYPEGAPLKYPRPRMINLYRCKNVLIRDISLLNSPAWTVHPVYCEDVTIDNIRIIQPYESPNTDGINPESSRNVRISNCFIDVGDDCITIKSGYNGDGRRVNIPCENISITNCTFARGRSAVGIGSETSGGVRNVVISNCVFQNTYRGLRIKSARGRGNVVENIRASNIVMENVGTGISIDMFYGKDDETPLPVDVTTPHFRDIRYSHITGKKLNKSIEILGLPEAPVEGLSLYDIQFEAKTGMNCRFVKDAVFRDVEIQTEMGPSFMIYKTEEAVFDHIGSRKPLQSIPVISMSHSKEIQMSNCRAATGTSTFLEVDKMSRSGLQLSGNDLTKAVIPVDHKAQ